MYPLGKARGFAKLQNSTIESLGSINKTRASPPHFIGLTQAPTFLAGCLRPLLAQGSIPWAIDHFHLKRIMHLHYRWVNANTYLHRLDEGDQSKRPEAAEQVEEGETEVVFSWAGLGLRTGQRLHDTFHSTTQ